jgi:hypothetical protein
MQNSLDIGSADHVPYIITSLKEMRPMQNPFDIGPADLVPYIFERDATGSLFEILNYSGLGPADLVHYIITSLKEMQPVQNPFDIWPADLVPYLFERDAAGSPIQMLNPSDIRPADLVP